ICLKALAKKVSERYASMSELARALEQPQKSGFLGPRPNLVTPLTHQGPPGSGETDHLRLVCPQCRQKLRSPVTPAGKAGRCPRCKARIPVPGEAFPAPPVRPDPAATPIPPPSNSATVRVSRSWPATGLLLGGAATVLLLGLLLGWLVFGRFGKEP